MNKKTRKITLSGLFIALGILLPFLTGQIPSIGNKLLPMHIPVLLAGYVLGGTSGLLVGFITPILRSVLYTMPPMFPHAIAMAFELATYGLITGILYKSLPKKQINILVTLVGAMVAGRIVWGIVTFFLYGIQGNPFNLQIFFTAAVVNAIPGIILQIILIPLLVAGLEGANVIED